MRSGRITSNRKQPLQPLQTAGINTFFDVLDMDRDDFLQVPGIGEEDAAVLLTLIDELTVEEEAAEGAQPAKAASADPGAAEEVESSEESEETVDSEELEESEEPKAEPVGAAISEADPASATDGEPNDAAD